MNKIPMSYKKSFLDTTTTPNDKFWRQANSDFFLKLEKTLEQSFYIKKTEFNQQSWQNCVLLLAGSYLICRMKGESILEYIDLEEGFYKLENFKIYKKEEKCEMIGFSLHKNGAQAEFLCKKSSMLNKWMDLLSKYCIMTNFNLKYKMLHLLGSGGYGQVFLLEEIHTKILRAGKFIKLNPRKDKEKQQYLLGNEIRTLRRLNHPNIVKFHEVQELNNDIVLIMEYVNGDRLFDRIIRGKGLAEKDTGLIMKQLLSVLSYLRFKDIVHRDFKLENILVIKKDKDRYMLKVLDFGLATSCSKQELGKKGGTAGYVAPEVFNNEPYSFKSDLYSVGVIMYTCLTGKPLFSAVNYSELLMKNKKGAGKFYGGAWNKISQKGRDLLVKMLEITPAQRYSLDQVIQHPWLEEYLTSSERAELLEKTLQFVKIDIPKEGEISEIPTSRGHLPNLDRSPSFFNFDTMTNSVVSLNGLPSQFLAQTKDMNLDSFYKYSSRESEISDRSSQDYENTNSADGKMLGLPYKGMGVPTKKAFSQQSMSSKDVESYNFGSYNIQIHGIGGSKGSFLDDIDHVPSDDEIPCSELYKKLHPIPLFFPRRQKYLQKKPSSKASNLSKKKSQSVNVV